MNYQEFADLTTKIISINPTEKPTQKDYEVIKNGLIQLKSHTIRDMMNTILKELPDPSDGYKYRVAAGEVVSNYIKEFLEKHKDILDVYVGVIFSILCWKRVFIYTNKTQVYDYNQLIIGEQTNVTLKKLYYIKAGYILEYICSQSNITFKHIDNMLVLLNSILIECFALEKKAPIFKALTDNRTTYSKFETTTHNNIETYELAVSAVESRKLRILEMKVNKLMEKVF